MGMERTRTLLPAVALVGVLLVLDGVSRSLSRAIQVWQAFQYQAQPQMAGVLGLDFTKMELIRQLVLVALGLVAVIAGVGLLRRARWARMAAVLALGGLAVMELLPLATQLAPQVYKMIAPGLPLSFYLPHLLYLLSILFTAMLYVLLLLALLTPAVRRGWRDGWKAGRIDRWAAWLASRVPPGVPAATALLALLFLCWAAPTFLHYQSLLQSAYSTTQQVFGIHDVLSNGGEGRMQLVSMAGLWITLLLPIGYLLAGAGLLLRQSWARFVGFGTLALAICQYVLSLFSFVFVFDLGASRLPHWYFVPTMLFVLFQMAYYAAVMNFLARHPVATGERAISDQ
ncbi:MAG: hypothetical protein ACYDBB_22790 [Armatimonadota bacterium]